MVKTLDGLLKNKELFTAPDNRKNRRKKQQKLKASQQKLNDQAHRINLFVQRRGKDLPTNLDAGDNKDDENNPDRDSLPRPGSEEDVHRKRRN